MEEADPKKLNPPREGDGKRRVSQEMTELQMDGHWQARPFCLDSSTKGKVDASDHAKQQTDHGAAGAGLDQCGHGSAVVRDPQCNQRWQVPVGGQYIYGRNTGEIIRADRPLQTHELPVGFRQFEAVK